MLPLSFNVTIYFYPRSPCGERPSFSTSIISVTAFLSTLSLRRATVPFRPASHLSMYFYPRSPCGERLVLLNSSIIVMIFLSTLSLRRATFFLPKWAATVKYFYPRSPCGERQVGQKRFRQKLAISIHALLAESDCQWRRSIKLFRQFLSTLSLRRATDQNWASSSGPLFLSTLSLRRATRNRFAVVDVLPISIHALLAESDAMPPATAPTAVYFYPRSPCGERPSRGRNRKN